MVLAKLTSHFVVLFSHPWWCPECLCSLNQLCFCRSAWWVLGIQGTEFIEQGQMVAWVHQKGTHGGLLDSSRPFSLVGLDATSDSRLGCGGCFPQSVPSWEGMTSCGLDFAPMANPTLDGSSTHPPGLMFSFRALMNSSRDVELFKWLDLHCFGHHHRQKQRNRGLPLIGSPRFTIDFEPVQI